jgi:hypothetical protein
LAEETPYGYCGLCGHHTTFPHECPNADKPVDDKEEVAA